MRFAVAASLAVLLAAVLVCADSPVEAPASHPQWRTDVLEAFGDAFRDDRPILVLATAGAPDGFS